MEDVVLFERIACEEYLFCVVERAAALWPRICSGGRGRTARSPHALPHRRHLICCFHSGVAVHWKTAKGKYVPSVFGRVSCTRSVLRCVVKHRCLELDPADHVMARRGLVRLLLDAGDAEKARAIIDR